MGDATLRGQNHDRTAMRELIVLPSQIRNESLRRFVNWSIASWSPVKKCQPSAVPARAYVSEYVAFFLVASSGPSRGSKLTVNTRYCFPSFQVHLPHAFDQAV